MRIGVVTILVVVVDCVVVGRQAIVANTKKGMKKMIQFLVAWNGSSLIEIGTFC
jgi:Na+-translocating ferredoxin:NAD+ oxidoreductase RnfE subunit